MTEPFLKIPLSLYRTGIISVVGHNLVTVYNALRCYIFRAQNQGTLSIQKLTQEGHLVAEVSQGKLGRILGMKRQTINKLLQQLSVLGWIQYDTLEIHRVCTYVLGYWTEINEKREEIFYSDLYLKDLEDNIERAIRNRRIQLPLYNKKEHTSDENYQEEEFKFRLSFISNYIAEAGKDLISSILKNKTVSSFSEVKPTQRLLKNTDFVHKIYSIGAAVKSARVSASKSACAPKGTDGVSLRDYREVPERTTEYINSEKIKEEKDKREIYNNIIENKDLDVGSLFVESFLFKEPKINLNNNEVLVESDSNFKPKINEGPIFKNKATAFEKENLAEIENSSMVAVDNSCPPTHYTPLFSLGSGQTQGSTSIGFSLLASDEFYTEEGFNRIVYGKIDPVLELDQKVEKMEEDNSIELPEYSNYTQESLAEANKWATANLTDSVRLYKQWRGSSELNSSNENLTEDGEVSDVDGPDDSFISKTLLQEYFEHERIEVAPVKKVFRSTEEIKKHWMRLYSKNFPNTTEYKWTARDTALIDRLAIYYNKNGGLGCVYNYISFVFHMWDHLKKVFQIESEYPSVPELSSDLHTKLFPHMFKIQKSKKFAMECEAKFKEFGVLPFEEIHYYEEELEKLKELGVTTWTNKISEEAKNVG